MNNETGSSNDAFTTFLTFLGGAAAGALAALLLAPKAGRDVRHDIVETAQRGANKARLVPGAVKEASGAAKEAFGEAMSGGANS